MTSKPLSLAVLAPAEPHLIFQQYERVSFADTHAMNLRAINPVLRGQICPGNNALWTNNWVCKSCRTKPPPRVRALNTQTSAKPYYITTPIFYVNAGMLWFLVVRFRV